MSKQGLSRKGRQLLRGYRERVGGDLPAGRHRATDELADYDFRHYRDRIRVLFSDYSIASVLDYGCTVADWGANGFDAQSGRSAADYLGLQEVNQYDPAVGAGRRRQVDCVVSFGLLEHVYISDVPPVLRDMFSCAARLMVLNVACYPDTETFPDGENSRITVRQPGWWKGMLDGISVDFPETSVCLICSTGWRQGNAFPIWKSATWQEDSSFVVGI